MGNLLKIRYENEDIMPVGSIILVAVAVILLSASVFDVRSREISDVHWMVIGTIGMVTALFSEDLLGGILCAAGYLMIMLFMFSGKVQGKVSVAVIVLGLSLLLASSMVSSSPYPIVTAVMTMIFLGMFFLGTMKGGADVKALVTLSFVFPAYPEVTYAFWDPVYPTELVFNPVFSSFFIAVILSSVYAVAVNIHRSGGTRISSYITTKEDAESSFVWTLEEIDDNHVRVALMIPFLLPLTIGFLTTMILGSPLFAII